MSFSNLKEQFINSKEFKTNWKLFKKIFGNEIDILFVNDYDKRIILYKSLVSLYNKEFNKSYNAMRHLLQCCNNEEKEIIGRIINLTYNEEEMSKVKIGDYLKRDNAGGYYLVVDKINDKTVIKKCFDFEFNYCLNSRRLDCFHIIYSDLKTYQFASKNEVKKIKDYLSKNNEEERFTKNTNKMISFKKEILNSDFKVANDDTSQFKFYRTLKEKVAFIINLKDKGDYIEVSFGFTSIVDKGFFEEFGESVDNIKIRFQNLIYKKEDELVTRNKINEIYGLYKDISKEDLLLLKKEKQKEFIKKINNKLKPLGFKKKNTIWIKELLEDYHLVFAAYKSQWSDVYMFDIYIRNFENKVIYLDRINTNNNGVYSWQFLSDEEINELFNYIINNVLEPIISLPIEEIKKYKILF